jgi:hypothetical protein
VVYRLEITDSEHHLLFECPAMEYVQAAFTNKELRLADGDLGCLVNEVYCPETDSRLHVWYY